MFGKAMGSDDARMKFAEALAKGNDSEADALCAKKVKCDECGKKFIMRQGLKGIKGGFDLTCPHCGVERPTIVVAPRRR